MTEFVILEEKKKYQDFWLNMRNATQENFQTDLSILLKEQETLENKLEKIQQEKDRIFKLIQILNTESEDKTNG
jgi:ABC-type phosphate transport system auxiliary subunit